MTFDKSKFSQNFRRLLVDGSATDRKEWAQSMVANKVDVMDFVDLLYSEKKIAVRFSWFLSELGMVTPEILFLNLSVLFEISKEPSLKWFQESFAMYWLLCGIPKENEAQCYDLLLGFINNKEVSDTVKLRSIKVLELLVVQYPDLKPEFIMVIQNLKVSSKGSLLHRVNLILKGE